MDQPSTASSLPADPHAAAVELLRRVAEHSDKEAFAELYDRFSGAVFATILAMVKERADAEDALQDCFCSIWDHAEQYDPAKGKAVSWIMTIARNKGHDAFAKRKRQGKIVDRVKEVGHEHPEDGQSSAFDSVAASEESKAVREALEDLPQDQRQAIQLAFIKGMTQTEVADALHQPLGTIKARIRRGLYQMRGTLQPHLTGPAS